MTTDINLIGELSTTGTVFFVSPTRTISKVITLRFNNPAAYTLTLAKYDASTSNTVTVYTLNLSAGDTVTDSFVYILNPGEYLTATSSILGTSYILVGISNPI